MVRVDNYYGKNIPRGANFLRLDKKIWVFSDVIKEKLKNKDYTGDYLFLLDEGSMGYVYCECTTGKEAHIEYYELDQGLSSEEKYRITQEVRLYIHRFLKEVGGLEIRRSLQLHYTNLQLPTRHGDKLIPVTVALKDFKTINTDFNNSDFAAWFKFNVTDTLQQIADKYYHMFKKPLMLYLMEGIRSIGTLVVEKEDIKIVMDFGVLLDLFKKKEDIRGMIYHEVLHHLKEIKKTTLKLKKLHEKLDHAKPQDMEKHVIVRDSEYIRDIQELPKDVENMLLDIVVNLSLRAIAPKKVVENFMPRYVKTAYGHREVLEKIREGLHKYSSLEQFYFLADLYFIPYNLTEALGPIIFTNPKASPHEPSVMDWVNSSYQYWDRIVTEKLNPVARDLVLEFFKRYCNCLSRITCSERKKAEGLFEEEYNYMPEDAVKYLVNFSVDAVRLLSKEGEITNFEEKVKKMVATA